MIFNRSIIRTLLFYLILGLGSHLIVFPKAFAEKVETDNKFNVYTNPLSFILGGVNLGFQYAVTDKIALGAHGVAVDADVDDAEINGRQFNLNATFFFDKAYSDGWYAKIEMGRGNIEAENSVDRADVDLGEFGLTAGYLWQWQSGFNILLGAGARQVNIDINEVTDPDLEADIEDLDGLGLAIDFNLGWSF